MTIVTNDTFWYFRGPFTLSVAVRYAIKSIAKHCKIKMTQFWKILTMRARPHFPNWFMMMLCYLGAFSDFNKLNTSSDMGVGGVPQRAVLPHFPLLNRTPGKIAYTALLM